MGEQIRRNYEAMEAEKTKLLISTETQKVVEKQAQTEQLRATIEAQMNADVSATKMKMNIAEKQAQQEMQAIADSMHLAKEKANADAQFYTAKKESEGNSLLLTDAYLEFMHIQSLANNTKVYFGDKMPSMFVERPRIPHLNAQ